MSAGPQIPRRTLLLGLGALAGVAGLPRLAFAGGAKVMVIGGSAFKGALGKMIEDGIAEGGHEATRHAVSSTGLARPDFHDWPKEAGKLYASYQPSATVVMFGGNDGQGLWMGKDADPPWIRWQEEGWSEEYARRVDQFAEAVAPKGEQIFWIGMPRMRQSKLDGRMQRMNEIFRAGMAKRPAGHFIDTTGILADAKGNYVEHMTIKGSRTRVRASDGIHLSMSGAKASADAIVPQILSRLAPKA